MGRVEWYFEMALIERAELTNQGKERIDRARCIQFIYSILDSLILWAVQV